MVVRGNFRSILCLAVICTWLYVVWPSAAAPLLKHCLCTGNHVQLRVRLNISSHVFERGKKLPRLTAALSRVNAARRRLKRGIKRPHTTGIHICRSRASTVHIQPWFKGCSPVGGLLDKGWCQSLHNVIVHCKRHPHKPRKGSWIFVTQLMRRS